MPRVLFTAETAKTMAVKSLLARARKSGAKQAIQEARFVSSSEPTLAVVERSNSELSERSNYVRLGLADMLVKSVEQLKLLPWKVGLDHIKAKNEAVKLIAGSGSQVFGWSDDGGSPLILVGEMRNCLDIKPAACGVAPTTDSVQPDCGQLANNTSPQVPDCQQLTDKPTEQK